VSQPRMSRCSELEAALYVAFFENVFFVPVSCFSGDSLLGLYAESGLFSCGHFPSGQLEGSVFLSVRVISFTENVFSFRRPLFFPIEFFFVVYRAIFFL